MAQLSTNETLFVVTSFLFQLLLLGFFVLRRLRFDTAIRYGRWMYALALLPAAVAVILLAAGEPWWLWLGGFLALAWALFGYIVDYVRNIPWRTPFFPRVGFPYITLYLAMLMFLWWPLGRFSRALWTAFGLLFLLATFFNVTSHGPRDDSSRGTLAHR